MRPSCSRLIHQVIADGHATPGGVRRWARRRWKPRSTEWTPERAAALTGIDADVIRRIAGEFADRGSRCRAMDGSGCRRSSSARCASGPIQVLNIITGNLDRPGGTMFPRPAVDTLRGTRAWASRRVEEPGPRAAGVRRRAAGVGDGRGDPDAGRRADPRDGDDRRQPGAVDAERAASSTRRCESLEFMVAIDPYINETTRHADVILPPTPPLEREHYDLTFHQLAVRNTARWNDAVLPRSLSEARHDWEIFRDLGTGAVTTYAAEPAPARRGARDCGCRLRRVVDLGLRIGPYGCRCANCASRPAESTSGRCSRRCPERCTRRTNGSTSRQALILDDLPRACPSYWCRAARTSCC